MTTTTKPHYRVPATASKVTSDGLMNVATSLGTSRDKRSHSFFGYSFVTQQELEAAYQTNWIARGIVDNPNEDATREWRSFTNTEFAKEIQNEEKRLKVQQRVQQLGKWADLYGGAGMLMITDQDLSKPLDLNKIKKGSLKRLVSLSRYDLSGLDYNYNDPTQENFLLPTYYTLFGGSQQIHYSHVVRRNGSDLPRALASMEQGWGDSILRVCMEDLHDMVSTKGGIAGMILEANVDTITKAGLSNALTSGEDDAILMRYKLFGMMKSSINLALLDQDEQLDRKSLSFSGLSQIMEQFMVYTAGAARQPATRLFGAAATGLNATGEGDMKNYYDRIRVKQEGDMRSGMEQLDQVMVRSALGEYPEDLEFEWNPLHQESGTERAQQNLAEAQADSARLADGVIQRSHVMKKLQASGLYDITDEQIEAQEALEDEDRASAEDFPVIDLDGEQQADAQTDEGRTAEQ